jgi:hypothetical protein
VIADGLFRQHQPAGDLMVAQASRDQLQHLPLAFSQLGKYLRGILLVGAGEERHDAAGHRGAVDRLAGRNRLQCPQDLGLVGALEQISADCEASTRPPRPPLGCGTAAGTPSPGPDGLVFPAPEGGIARAMFRVAVSGRRDQQASFFTVVVWRDQAEHAAESLSKGSRVVVMGRLQQRSWTAEDGSTRSVVEVVAEELGASLRWATATTTRTTRSQEQASTA